MAFPSLCFPDMGLPLLSIPSAWPALVLLGLLAVIFIETWMFRRALREALGKTVLAIRSAKVASTLLGYPLSWIVLVATLLLFSAVPNPSGPLTAVPEERIFYGLFHLMTMAGLIPAFFVSAHCEYFITRSFFRNEERCRVKRLSYKANGITYLNLHPILVVHFVCIYLAAT